MRDLYDKYKYWLIGAGIVVVILLVYGVGVNHYQSQFMPNTYASTTNISGLTPEEAQEKLAEDLATYQIKLVENDQDLGYIELGQLDFQIDAVETLNQAVDKQNPFVWPFRIVQRDHMIDVSNTLQTDPELRTGLLASLNINNQDRQPTENAKLVENEDQTISVTEEVYGNQISIDSLEQALVQKVGQGQTRLNLEDAYVKPLQTKDSDAMNQLLADVEQMHQTQITLEFDGNSVTIPSENITMWIYIDEAGQPQVDTAAVEQYILEDINQRYASLFMPRKFNSTYGGEVTIEPGTFGWYIDRFPEAEEITANILAGGTYVREPQIGGSGYGQEDEIGQDYVEIDIPNQMMIIYRDGEIVLETPIVSGVTGANTVPGAYQVWQKLEDTDLTGYNTLTEQNYVQPVSYWIAFDDNAQGIHDAEWQTNFGGNVYQTAGSLGCINTPPSVMEEVFDLVEIGMPVLVFA